MQVVTKKLVHKWLMKRIKSIFISIIYLVYIQITFFFCKKRKLPYCIVLAYHSVPDNEAARFKQQMHILKRLTIPIPINYDGPFDSRARYSIITFDDAFKSVIRNAVPEMTKLRIPFTIFIPAGYLGTNPGWLEKTGDSDVQEIVSSIEELSGLPAEIVTFGSHTVNHADLNAVDCGKAFYEMKEAKVMLESQFNREIEYFAFPYGHYNSKLVECCHEAGYKQTFSVTPESSLDPLRKYVKGRIIVRPSDWKVEYTLKILGGYGWRAIAGSRREILKS